MVLFILEAMQDKPQFPGLLVGSCGIRNLLYPFLWFIRLFC